MAQPAKLPEEDQPDIAPNIPELRALEGGGESTPRKSGHLKSAPEKDNFYNPGGDSTTPSPSELKDNEESPNEDESDDIYNPADKSGLGGPRRFFRKVRINRKAAAAMGGIAGVGIFGTILLSSIAQGPIQLVHLSEILQRNQQSSNDNSKLTLGRLYRFAKTGNVGETRLGGLSSKVFNRSMNQLADIGVEFQRNSLDHITSATIDTEKLSKTYPELKGMSDEETKAFLADKLGVDGGDLIKDGGKYKFDAQKLSIKSTRLLVKNSLGFLENGRIITGIKFRAMAKFYDIPNMFHPIKKASVATKKSLLSKVGRASVEEERVKAAEEPVTSKAGPPESSLKDKINGKNIASSALLATAGICLIRSVADNVVEVNRASIVVPVLAQAIDKTAVGDQVKSGQDIDEGQVGAVAEGFVDQDGKTIWQGKAMQALAGMPQTGADLGDEYKQAFSGATTAQGIKDTLGAGEFGSVACSPLGQVIQGVAGLTLLVTGFFDGGASWAVKAGSAAAGTVGTVGAITLLEKLGTNILSDKALVPDVLSGPLGGNLLAYGAREAANTDARSSGGIELSSQESAMLDQRQLQQDQQQFKSESFFARTFDTKDYRSLTGRLADSLSPSFSRNLASASGNLMNTGNLFAGAFSSLIPKAHAEDKPYDWPFPRYAIPSSMMSDPDLQDPYANGDAVAAILDAGDPSGYIGRAKTCFGVDISKGDEGWDIQATDPVNPNTDDYVNAHCDDTSDKGWQRVIMFVSDTNTMKAIACHEGEDDVCTELGFGSAQGTDTISPTDTPTVSGDAQELAQQILDSKNVSYPYVDSSGHTAEEVLQDVVKTGYGFVDGSNAPNTKTTLSVNMLKTILEYVQGGSPLAINCLSNCTHTSSSSEHYTGQAVDLDCSVPLDESKWNGIMQKYGGSLDPGYPETCPNGAGHWHFRFPKGGN